MHHQQTLLVHHLKTHLSILRDLCLSDIQEFCAWSMRRRHLPSRPWRVYAAAQIHLQILIEQALLQLQHQRRLAHRDPSGRKSSSSQSSVGANCGLQPEKPEIADSTRPPRSGLGLGDVLLIPLRQQRRWSSGDECAKLHNVNYNHMDLYPGAYLSLQWASLASSAFPSA